MNGNGVTAMLQNAKPSYRFDMVGPPAALADLRDKPVWLCWDYVWKEDKGKWTKPPMSATTGRIEKGTLSASGFLATFDQAMATMRRRGLAGVGISLEHAKLTGIDLDDCVTETGFSLVASEVMSLAETYAEFSPSGTGIHLLTKACGATVKRDDLGIEIYSTGRYFTLTGRALPDMPGHVNGAYETLSFLQGVVDRHSKPGKNDAPKSNTGAPPGGDFFESVNRMALERLEAWVPTLHPRAKKQTTGGWRVTSCDLGRDREEDISYHPDGIQDFGDEHGMTAIGAVMRFGMESDAKSAALWLCQRMGVEPAALGWRGDKRKQAQPGDTEIQGPFKLIRSGRDAGVYFDARGEDEPDPAWAWVCSVLEPLAHSRDRESRNWGVLIEVVDGDGVRHVWPMPSTIGPTVGDGVEFRRELVHRGLRIAAGRAARERLSNFITMWRPKRKVRCVITVGWCGDAFVMPGKTYGGTEEIILQTEGVAPQFSTAGTLAAWRDDIARLCNGNSRLVFAVSAAFVGPLLRLAGEESGGVNFRGKSSIGKTAMLHAARSVWGVPLGSWRATDNAAEGIASGASDTFLNLDELGQVDPKVVGAIAYMLGNERGKARMTRNATTRAVTAWRVFFLSTGEVSLADRLREGGIRVRAGQEVRVLDVPAMADGNSGAFDTTHEFDPAALAEHIKVAADRNCGHPAIAFLEYVIARLAKLPAKLAVARTNFIEKYCPPGADGQVRRACGRFALVAAAGEMATAAGITGWEAHQAWLMAAKMFQTWLDARGGKGAAEVRDGILQVRAFLEAHGEARFAPAWSSTDGHATANRAGFRQSDAIDGGTAWTFYVLPTIWRQEVCKGFDAGLIAREMVEKGWMLPGANGKTSDTKRIPGHGKPRVYVIPHAFFSADI
jgi:putative DNA primase/helicase